MRLAAPVGGGDRVGDLADHLVRVVRLHRAGGEQLGEVGRVGQPLPDDVHQLALLDGVQDLDEARVAEQRGGLGGGQHGAGALVAGGQQVDPDGPAQLLVHGAPAAERLGLGDALLQPVAAADHVAAVPQGGGQGAGEVAGVTGVGGVGGGRCRGFGGCPGALRGGGLGRAGGGRRRQGGSGGQLDGDLVGRQRGGGLGGLLRHAALRPAVLRRGLRRRAPGRRALGRRTLDRSALGRRALRRGALRGAALLRPGLLRSVRSLGARGRVRAVAGGVVVGDGNGDGLVRGVGRELVDRHGQCRLVRRVVRLSRVDDRLGAISHRGHASPCVAPVPGKSLDHPRPRAGSVPGQLCPLLSLRYDR